MTPTSEKIKVLQIVRAPLGGIRKHIIAIIESLETHQFDWEWITSTEAQDFDKGFSIFFDTVAGARIQSIKINDKPELRDIRNIYSLSKLYKNKGIHIIHGHGAKGGLYARILGRIIGAKVIYTPHGGSLHDMFGILKGFVYAVIEKLLYPLTDLFVFESKYSMEQFEKKVTKNKRKVLLNRNGISLPQFKPLAEKNNKKWILGSFGALRFIKGHDIIIRAISELNNKNIECEYHIYGEGEERQNLLNLAESLGVIKQFKIFEKTTDVYSAMETCDIVLQPSRHESFGYVPLEAMGLGRVVIVSNQGGLKEIIEHERNGLMAPNLDVSTFVSLIKKVIDDHELKNKLVSQAREDVENNFSEAKMLENLKSHYISITRS